MNPKLFRNARRWQSRFAADTAGGSAIILALTMPIVIGGLGLGVEVGLWYQTERRLQAAADMAAFTAAIESGTSGDHEAAAEREAEANRFRPDVGAFELTTSQDGDDTYYRVTLSEPRPELFSAIFVGGGDIRVSASAAVLTEGGYCLFALDESKPQAMHFQGDPTSNFADCALHSNSDADDAIHLGGNPSVEAQCASTRGGVSGGDKLKLDCGTPRIGADRIDDPFEHLAPPSRSAKSERSCGGKCSGALEPGYYPDGIDVHDDVDLAPGVYYLDGDFKATGGNRHIRGDGVTLYFNGKSTLDIGGNATIDLSAPTSGPYAGVAMYFDPTAPYDNGHKFAGTIGAKYNGAVYSPASHVEFTGTSSAGSVDQCFQMVARTMKFSGNNEIVSNCTGDYDIRRTHVRLVE